MSACRVHGVDGGKHTISQSAESEQTIHGDILLPIVSCWSVAGAPHHRDLFRLAYFDFL